MIRRTIEVSSEASLSVSLGQLVVKIEGQPKQTVPLEDLGILLLSNPRITISHALISRCAAQGIAIISCDDSYLPCSITLPLNGHAMMRRVLAMQAAVKRPRLKRAWKCIVREKILAQARTLECLGGDARKLRTLSQRVVSGDSGNIEGVAAREYWQRLFGKGFRRRTESPGLNAILNYGYAVMRAAVARAIVGAGLHPAFSMHHSNQYNAFCLADDLMEPLRPSVDYIAAVIVRDVSDDSLLVVDRSVKAKLLGLLSADCIYEKRTYPLLVALTFFTAALRDFYDSKRDDLPCPAVILQEPL